LLRLGENAMSQYTSFLFINPSFCEGIGRIVDFAHQTIEYNYAKTSAEADQCAMKADWLAVGADIRAATADFAREEHLHRCLPENNARKVATLGVS
jgi:hypothetical protein